MEYSIFVAPCLRLLQQEAESPEKNEDAHPAGVRADVSPALRSADAELTLLYTTSDLLAPIPVPVPGKALSIMLFKICPYFKNPEEVLQFTPDCFCFNHFNNKTIKTMAPFLCIFLSC